MPWKVIYFWQNDTGNNNKNIYDSKSDKTPPPIKFLELFEKGMFKIVGKIKF